MNPRYQFKTYIDLDITSRKPSYKNENYCIDLSKILSKHLHIDFTNTPVHNIKQQTVLKFKGIDQTKADKWIYLNWSLEWIIQAQTKAYNDKDKVFKDRMHFESLIYDYLIDINYPYEIVKLNLNQEVQTQHDCPALDPYYSIHNPFNSKFSFRKPQYQSGCYASEIFKNDFETSNTYYKNNNQSINLDPHGF